MNNYEVEATYSEVDQEEVLKIVDRIPGAVLLQYPGDPAIFFTVEAGSPTVALALLERVAEGFEFTRVQIRLSSDHLFIVENDGLVQPVALTELSDAVKRATAEILRLREALVICGIVLADCQPSDAWHHAAQEAANAPFDAGWTLERTAVDDDPVLADRAWKEAKPS